MMETKNYIFSFVIQCLPSSKNLAGFKYYGNILYIVFIDFSYSLTIMQKFTEINKYMHGYVYDLSIQGFIEIINIDNSVIFQKCM